MVHVFSARVLAMRQFAFSAAEAGITMLNPDVYHFSRKIFKGTVLIEFVEA
jgi:hypothetical protein